MEEIWRTVVYNGEIFDNYEISSYGRVRSLNYRGHGKIEILKQEETNNGYLRVNVYNKKSKGIHLLVHRTVAFTFYDLIPNDNPTEKTQINHIDENKHNNHVSNLEWTTPKENSSHGTRTERVARGHDKKVRCIETGQIYDSVRQASRETGLNEGNLASCCRGKRETCGKLHWEYVD